MQGKRREEAKGLGRRGRCENTLMVQCVRESSGLGTRVRRAAHCGGTLLESEVGMCMDTDGCAGERPSDTGAAHRVRAARAPTQRSSKREGKAAGMPSSSSMGYRATGVELGCACRDADGHTSTGGRAMRARHTGLAHK
jgi:hypothetical protein